jgi:hypothetical protein
MRPRAGSLQRTTRCLYRSMLSVFHGNAGNAGSLRHPLSRRILCLIEVLSRWPTITRTTRIPKEIDLLNSILLAGIRNLCYQPDYDPSGFFSPKWQETFGFSVLSPCTPAKKILQYIQILFRYMTMQLGITLSCYIFSPCIGVI